MNRFSCLLVALTALGAGLQIARAQTPADHSRRLNRPVLAGSVESVGGRLRVSLDNADGSREFRGLARISLGASDQQSEAARFEFTLAPQESRFFPLDSRGVSGDRYTLAIYDLAGSLIFLKNAPIKPGVDYAPIAPPPATIAPVPASAVMRGAEGVTVKARLAAERLSRPQGGEIEIPATEQSNRPRGAEIEAPAAEQPSQPQDAKIKVPSAKLLRRRRGGEIKPPAVERPTGLQGGEIKTPAVERPTSPQGGEIEALVSDETGPVVLSFEIAAPAPIINANLSVNAKGFARSQAVTVRGSANVEFKLPDDFNEPKINYTLTGANGRTLVNGEVKLEDLKLEDSVTVSDVKLDKPSYAPGESAHLVMTLEGRSPYGYRLELTAKDGNETTLLKDSRKGVYHEGSSIQEFRIEIPADTKGVVTLEFKVFGNLTKKLFGSGVREIVVSDTQDDKPDNNQRLSP